MKHLAEWKSHEGNHALKEKLVILYSRYMKKVLVTGKGYSGALMRARVRARASGIYTLLNGNQMKGTTEGTSF